MATTTDLPLGKLICVGIRGASIAGAQLQQDLAACAAAQVGAILLFDVHVPDRTARNIVDADQVRRLTRTIRETLGADTWIAIDQEGGHVARLHEGNGFRRGPSAAEFARLSDAEQERVAAQQAEQLADLGIDWNLAPCVDLGVQPQNPIIAGKQRAYAADPQTVTHLATIVIEAHRRAGVATCLKHFPGHGSGFGDTHLGSVDVTDTWSTPELDPYRRLKDVPGVAVMAAHVMHRDLDMLRPASLSSAVLDGLLRTTVGFDGVVVTDSIDMRAVADRYAPGQAAVEAIRAGADLVVDGFNLQARERHPAPELAVALRQSIDAGELSTERIQRSLDRLARLRAEVTTAR